MIYGSMVGVVFQLPLVAFVGENIRVLGLEVEEGRLRTVRQILALYIFVTFSIISK